MDKFGPLWTNHQRRIGSQWTNTVGDKDIVLVPGDISWATYIEDAIPDLKWLHSLPGKKILLKGNHDLWWKKTSELQNLGLNTLHFIDKSSVQIGNWEFFGARLWDTSEYECHDLIDWTTEDGKAPEMYQVTPGDSSDKKYDKELSHLDQSIHSLKSNTTRKICLTHYPPTTHSLKATRAMQAIGSVPGVEAIVFGHLHQLKSDFEEVPFQPSGENWDFQLHLCSCDFLKMKPKLIAR